jgi:hypothetical protein
MEAYLFHADGQTDVAKLIVTVRNFTKTPKNDAKTALAS